MHQIKSLHKKFDELQLKYGDKNLNSIYGAGEIKNPRIMFVFMNPTGKNISSIKTWNGLRAPWLGTKNIWNIFNELNLLDENIFNKLILLKQNEWTENFSNEVYKNIESKNIYITNLAKCTQVDARPLKDSVFKKYLNLIFEEIEFIKPQKIITFGNQVSSILLNKKISVSNYLDIEFEELKIQNLYSVYPVYYPVGQGRRNQPLAINRIKKIM